MQKHSGTILEKLITARPNIERAIAKILSRQKIARLAFFLICLSISIAYGLADDDALAAIVVFLVPFAAAGIISRDEQRDPVDNWWPLIVTYAIVLSVLVNLSDRHTTFLAVSVLSLYFFLGIPILVCSELQRFFVDLKYEKCLELGQRTISDIDRSLSLADRLSNSFGRILSPSRFWEIMRISQFRETPTSQLRTSTIPHPSSASKTAEKGVLFEKIVAHALEGLGFRTSLTRASSDMGVDIIAEDQQGKIAVQCKYRKESDFLNWSLVSEDAADDLLRGCPYYGVLEGLIFTNEVCSLQMNLSISRTHGGYRVKEAKNQPSSIDEFSVIGAVQIAWIFHHTWGVKSPLGEPCALVDACLSVISQIDEFKALSRKLGIS